jgi:hypothetical protein
MGITSDSISSDTDILSCTEPAGTNSGSANVDDSIEKGPDEGDACGTVGEGSNGKCCDLLSMGITSDLISSDTDLSSTSYKLVIT